MINQDHNERLRRLAWEILDARHPFHSLGPEVKELTGLVRGLAPFQIDRNSDIAAGETWSERGLAVSPTIAAMCADDLARTVVFMRGLHDAVQDQRQQCSNRPTRILYCGCGPYALLALPVLAVASPDELSFTLLDIHEESVHSARSLLTKLGYGDFVTSCETADAGRYQIQPDEPPDVIVMEIMNVCLAKEPQVALTRHLLAQAPQARLVPEAVRIDARLVNTSQEFNGIDHQQQERDRIPLGTVFELNAKTVDAWTPLGNDRLPAASIRLPDAFAECYRPMLFTIVQVYGEQCLSDYDSALTIPRPFPHKGPIVGGCRVDFHYRLGSHPALVCDCVVQESV